MSDTAHDREGAMYERAAETMSRADLAALQLARLRDTFERTYAKVPHVRKKFDAAGVTPGRLNTLADIARFPFTAKADLRDNYPFGLFTVPREQIVRIHASSGTTGKPTVVGYTRADLDLWSDLMARSLVCMGAKPGDVFHNAFGYGLFTGGLGFHYGAERLGMTTVPVSGGATERQVILLRDFGAQFLGATPSYALNIAEVADGMGIDLRKLSLRYARLRRGALVGGDPARYRGEIRHQGDGHLRPVGDHRPRCRHRVSSGAGRTAHLGGPLLLRGDRSGHRRAGTPGRQRRACAHHAHQGSAADAPLSHPRHHAPDRASPASAAAPTRA